MSHRDPGRDKPAYGRILASDAEHAKVGVRVIDQERFKVTALTGARYWHLGELLIGFFPYGST